MDRDERKEHWERAWRAIEADAVSWYQAVPECSLAMIADAGIGPDEPVIDVGGGASLLIDHLLERGFVDLAVLDVSREALQRARCRLGARAARVEWIESDITAFEPTRPYRLWHDRAVFHFLTEAADRARYADTLRRALSPGGQAVIATFAPDGPRRCSGLEVVRHDAASLRTALGDGLELVDERAERHRTPSGGEQKFVYYRLVRRGAACADGLQSTAEESH
jgi:trans-aconitate methyltransferase